MCMSNNVIIILWRYYIMSQFDHCTNIHELYNIYYT